MKNLLIIRFSALGDVAMTIPVIHACAMQNPQLNITVLSREGMRPLFSRMPGNVHFIGANLKGRHQGVPGLNRLFMELRAMHFDAVADMHDVLRTKYLRMLFRLTGVKTAYIRKDRKQKKALTDCVDKRLVPLKTSFERYADTLRQLHIEVTPRFCSLFGEGKGNLKLVEAVTGEKRDGEHWIGVAPFAAHRGKIYPLPLMEKVIETLSHEEKYRIFLFGAGKYERSILEQWEAKYSRTLSLAGKLQMDTELVVMSHLDVMLSMDSANMHLASLTATPVLSIWGATHPYAGFMGWNQSEKLAIQLDMKCRPCSIYGNVPCMREDYACMEMIEPAAVVERIKQLIDKIE